MKIKKIRFNAIDVLIILVILAAVFAIAFRSGLKDSLVAIRSNETIVYTVKIRNLQEQSLALFEEGDELYNQNDDKYLGKVSKVIGSRKAETYIALDNGDIQKSYYPDGRIDIFLELECTGRVTDEGCMLGGNYFVASGKYVSAYTDDLTFGFEVTDAYKKQ